MEKKKDGKYLNKSLDKSLSILDLFDSQNVKLSVTEIARQFDVSRKSWTVIYSYPSSSILVPYIGQFPSVLISGDRYNSFIFAPPECTFGLYFKYIIIWYAHHLKPSVPH